jgi:hypothetical protein
MRAGSNWIPVPLQSAHEAMADMGVDGLIATGQKIGMEQIAASSRRIRFWSGSPSPPRPKTCGDRLKHFKGIPWDHLAG